MLDCILGQDFPDFEFIVLDNGSVDGTAAVCRAYAARDARLRIISLPENSGPAGAKNRLLQEAGTDFVAFVDDDDYCAPNYLACLMGLQREYSADIAVTGCSDELAGQVIPKFNYEAVYVWNSQQASSALLQRRLFNGAPPTKLFRLALFDGICFEACPGPDDIHIIYKLIAIAKRTVVCGEPLYHFHKHPQNVTAFITDNMITGVILAQYLRMEREREAFMAEHLPAVVPEARYAAWSYMISLLDKVLTGHGRDCEAEVQYMRNELKAHRREFLAAPWLTRREAYLMEKYIDAGEVQP